MLGKPKLCLRIIRSHQIAEVEPKTHVRHASAVARLLRSLALAVPDGSLRSLRCSRRIALSRRLLRRRSDAKNLSPRSSSARRRAIR